MVKMFSANSLSELEDRVNEYEKEYGRLFYFSNHSVSYSDGVYVICIVLTNKDYN